MSNRDTLTVGELRAMLDGVDDSLEVYVQKTVTPISFGDYVDAHGGEVAVGVEQDRNQIFFPDPVELEDEDFKQFPQKDYFLIFP